MHASSRQWWSSAYHPGVESDRLSTMLEDLLAHGETWVPGLARYVISPSRPAADCSLLAVWAEGIRTTAPSKAHCMLVSLYTVHITIFDCTPVQQQNQKPPRADLITASATALVDKAQALWYGVLDAWNNGTLFSDESVNCGEVDLSLGMRAVDAAGGLAGWDVPITITL